MTKNKTGATASNEVAEVQSGHTTIQLPPGVLTTGASYVFVVIALSFPGSTVDPEATPRKTPWPEAYAQALTGTFQAP